jgi:hypothetical protein
MLHVLITFYLVWCNVLMHIYINIYIYVCLLVLVHLRVALQLDHDLFSRFEESTIKCWRPSDQALRVLRD